MPAQAARARASAYVKFSHPASRYAVIGVAAVVTRQRRHVHGGGGGDRRARAAATRAVVGREALIGQALSRRRPSRRAAPASQDLGDDILGDIYASAEYRKAVAPVCVKRALAAAAARTANVHVTCTASVDPVASIDELAGRCSTRQRYIADRGLATSIYLALKLQRPLFLEGEAGVGKTEVAKVLAPALGTELIRLQCYEGLDVSHAVYEWNYARQLLEIRLLEAVGRRRSTGEAARELFSEAFLIKRPLLQALEPTATRPPVLLIDELDRADEEFEGFCSSCSPTSR